MAGDDRAGRLQQAVGFVLDRQRFDGGFGLWSASAEAEPWLSAYATEFLLRARAAGAAVPDQALTDALKFLAGAADEPGDKPEDLAAQAYRLYVLALAGQGRPGAARVLAEQHRQAADAAGQGAARRGAGAGARPAARRGGVRGGAGGARRGKWWAYDYGTALRDQAAIAVLLKESGLPGDRLDKLLAGPARRRPVSRYAVARRSRPGPPRPARCSAGTARRRRRAGWQRPAAGAGGVGRARPGRPTARNLADQPVWRAVSVTGVPATPLPAARSQMRVTRQFMTLDGSRSISTT